VNCQKISASVSNSTRRHGRTVRSIVLEAVDLDQGSEFSSIAQVVQHVSYILLVLIRESLYLAYD
jgi:hypothetical protein